MEGLKGHSEIKQGSERNFGVVFSIVFVLIALFPLLNNQSVRTFWLVAAVLMLVVAFIVPDWLRGANRAWFKFGLLLGALVSPIVMLLVYVTTFIPIGLILRMFGKDPLHREFNRESSSYWEPRQEQPGTMKNQF